VLDGVQHHHQVADDGPVGQSHGQVEVGWIFDPAHGGQGYATEAVRALLDLVFTALQARRAVARVDERNTSSRRLCERLGMRAEAHLVENEVFKGELSSEVDYALLSREWPPATSSPSY
jgi:RimJ/RimL family protein N-acetyltransferase